MHSAGRPFSHESGRHASHALIAAASSKRLDAQASVRLAFCPGQALTTQSPAGAQGRRSRPLGNLRNSSSRLASAAPVLACTGADSAPLQTLPGRHPGRHSGPATVPQNFRRKSAGNPHHLKRYHSVIKYGTKALNRTRMLHLVSRGLPPWSTSLENEIRGLSNGICSSGPRQR